MCLNRTYIKLQTKRLRELHTPDGLWGMLQTNGSAVSGLKYHSPYQVFFIPKSGGGKRLIENPVEGLKKLLRKLNTYLVPMYYLYKTKGAYGFMIRPENDDNPRNILTNALRHAQNPYLLILDLKNYFHYVGRQILNDTLVKPPFALQPETANSITDLCTYKGRLPMGAPTSPALSNIAAYKMDTAMEHFCKREEITFTRFVDDMCFSSKYPLTLAHFFELDRIINQSHFCINTAKIKWYGQEDEKMITGLVIKDGKVSVPEDFLKETEKEINLLKSFALMTQRMNPGKPVAQFIKLPVQKINGALAFIKAISGENSPQLLRMKDMLEDAKMPPADYETLHWLDIGYDYKI